MSANDPGDEQLWISAFDELGAGLQKAAVTRASARPYPTRRLTWLIAAAALAILPAGLALALSGGETEVPEFGTPAPPPLEAQISSSVTCENGDVLEVTEEDFRRAVAELPPVPGPSSEPVSVPPDAPLGYRFVCGSDGDVSVTAVTK